MGKSKEKKKQSLEGEEQSAKMGKQAETLNVHIKAIGEIPDKKTSPIIGYFPSGFDPLKNSEAQDSNSNSGASSSVRVYKNQNPRNPKNPRMEVVVGVEGSAVNFVGTNYAGEARAPQLCNYALWVLDKATGVLKMVPIAANKVFRLEPKFLGLEQHDNETRVEDFTAEEMAAKRRMTTDLYGSKKSIRKDEKREILRQTQDPEALKGMEDKLKGIKVKMEALDGIETATNERNIPPYTTTKMLIHNGLNPLSMYKNCRYDCGCYVCGAHT